MNLNPDDEAKQLKEFLAERNAVFRNPTLELATAFWERQGLPTPSDKKVPLASVHKARLQWLGATNYQIKESLSWLKRNGYGSEMHGAPPLTPERRDADRVSLGKKPLGDSDKNEQANDHND